ncbi:hypothetical protein KY327_03250 [Candidatus Woesearchaeota archaeon]|nr:hypothetical protein [Candidatus Woesearchaeota archaeon]
MKVLTHILVVSLAMFLLASSGAALDYAALGFSPPLASSLDSSDVVFSDEAANDSLTVTVQDELIYRYGHYSLDGGPWHRFELSGERLYGDWIPGDCGASLAFSATTFDLQPGEVGTDNYVLTYSCSYASGGWGCHDGLWQLLQFNVSLNAAAAEEEPVVAGRCLAGDVYWFDDSGVPLDVKDACGVNETCLDGACVGEPASTGNVILVESPGEHNDIGPNLLAAFGNASAGDTVLLPAGSFRVVGKVYYDVRDKPGLHLKGAGSGPNGTRLYRDYETSDSMLSLVSTSGLPEVEVSDIWFQGMEVRLNDTDTGSTTRVFLWT